MKTAFIQFASGSVHFATSLEILKKAHNAGEESFYCLWGARTKYPGRMSVYFESLSGQPPRHIKDLIRQAHESVHLENNLEFDKEWVDESSKSLIRQSHSIINLSQLKRLNYLGVQPGPGLANEITTLTKNRDLDFSANRGLMIQLIQSYLEVYSATTKYATKNRIEKIHIFNGRFLHERAVWDAGRALGIDVVLFETTRNRYFQRREGFHNRTNNQKVMLEHWNTSSDSLPQKLSKGAKYFEELRSKSNPFQVQIPVKLEVQKPFFVYFSSSDDEAVGFWDEWDEGLGDQLSCVSKLQTIFDAQDQFQLIVRLHPNLENKSNEQKLGWMAIKNTKSTTIIESEQQVSSYALLDDSIGTITFGSTLGLESAYAFKPSLLLADSGYDIIGVVDKAKTWFEVSEWIVKGHRIDEGELLNRRNNACIRGYFLATGGLNFQYSQLQEIGWGAWKANSFEGTKIPPNFLVGIYRRIISKIKFRKILKLINNG